LLCFLRVSESDVLAAPSHLLFLEPVKFSPVFWGGGRAEPINGAAIFWLWGGDVV